MVFEPSAVVTISRLLSVIVLLVMDSLTILINDFIAVGQSPLMNTFSKINYYLAKVIHRHLFYFGSNYTGSRGRTVTCSAMYNDGFICWYFINTIAQFG